ncbi:MAG: peroxide stress protein YaaA [Bacteroidetes bacterium]|nr:peroxide stress protein YaaA [Bacteroidota bacterium]
MIAILSPAKTLDFESPLPTKKYTVAQNIDKALPLIAGLKKMSPKKIGELMELSDNLSQLNHQRYQSFTENHDTKNARPAVFTFSGEVANGLDAGNFSAKEIDYAQKHLRILSGLYGLLKPLDLIQPYRLEMGTSWGPAKNKNLYAYWGNTISEQLNDDLGKSKTLINLASNEYFKAVNPKILNAEIISCNFKEKKGSDYKIVMVFAKKARGMMGNYIVKNQIDKSEDLKNFDLEGYAFNKKLSENNNWVFTRG